YRHRLDPTIRDLEALFGEGVSDVALWAEMKTLFARLAAGRQDLELAETFFNSASRRIFHTVGVDSRAEFVSSEPPSLPLDAAAAFLVSFAGSAGTRVILERALSAVPFAAGWEDLARDAALGAEKLDAALEEVWGAPHFDSLEMLRPVFFRSKGAYLIGRVHRGDQTLPLVVALLNRDGRVTVDAVLADEDEASIVFSFTRSYFHVECPRPAALVAFLKALMPKKPVGELYTALGFNKHGKTELSRDLLRHLASSEDRFVEAPGAAGMVMLVFTLPSYDVVFKVIRDSFAPPKTTGRQDVLDKYRLVFHHTRAGRLEDVQEFEHLSFPASRFDSRLLERLLAGAAETGERRGSQGVFPHLFTERRLTPLDIFLRDAAAETARNAAVDFGEAIRDLAKSNIFPGDLLPKNFGLTRHGRVVFYDYDEICFLTDVNFRELPPDLEEGGWVGEQPPFWVGPGDVFPEEFLTFMGPPTRPSSSATPTSSRCGSGSTSSAASARARSWTFSRTRGSDGSGRTVPDARSDPGARRGLPDPRSGYSMTWMLRLAHISFRTFGHTVTLTSPRCAFRRRSIRTRDWPMPPPIESGSVPFTIPW